MAYFKNPQNGYVEKVTTVFSWLWVLLLGPLYLLFRGFFLHALVYVLLYVLLFWLFDPAEMAQLYIEEGRDDLLEVIPVIENIWVFLLIAVPFFYAFLIYKLADRRYQRKGWVKVDKEGKELVG